MKKSERKKMENMKKKLRHGKYIRFNYHSERKESRE